MIMLCKKYGLDCVKVESLGFFNSYNSMCDCLEKTFKEVASSTISEDEEGSVVYFIKRDFES